MEQYNTTYSENEHEDESSTSNQDTLYTCHCGKNFKTKKNLWIHETNKHGEFKLEFACPIKKCDKKYIDPYLLRVHLKTIHQKTITIERAKIFGIRVKNSEKSKPKVEGSVKTEKAKKYTTTQTCPLCQMVFSNTGNFNKHLKNKHSNVKGYENFLVKRAKKYAKGKNQKLHFYRFILFTIIFNNLSANLL